MACDYKPLKREQTPEQRRAQVAVALKQLESLIAQGRVKVIVDKATGAVAFSGWTATDRAGLGDACAYRRLSTEQSWTLRRAVMAAEALAGRKVSEKAVAAGVHSHDGGKTFGPGHGSGG